MSPVRPIETPHAQAAHLTRRYGPVVALDDVSLSIGRGEVLGLIGPNGAGKTTLFECLAGVIPADAGEVTIDGRRVPAADRCRHLFYLPDAIARPRRRGGCSPH